MNKKPDPKNASKEADNPEKQEEVAGSETDISEEVIDDGYLDISDDKLVAIFFVGAQRAIEKNFGEKQITTERLLKKLPDISNFCDVQVFDFANIPTASLTPQIMLDLSKNIQEKLSQPAYSGAVVVHGADSLEETAFFTGISLSEQFQFGSFKPIVFTPANNQGAMLPDELTQNLLASIRVACHDFREAAPQVLICSGGEIHGPKKVQRVGTSGTATFKSPGWGPVGHVDQDAVYIRPGSMNEDVGLNFPILNALTAHVALVKAVTGDSGVIIDTIVEKGVDGIVVEGFGAGNVPAEMMDSIRNAIQKGVVVVIATRCEQGRVLDDVEFPGSLSDLIHAGALSAGETDAAKARLLTAYVLSQFEAKKLQKQNLPLFKAFLQECLDPVLADRLFGL